MNWTKRSGGYTATQGDYHSYAQRDSGRWLYTVRHSGAVLVYEHRDTLTAAQSAAEAAMFVHAITAETKRANAAQEENNARYRITALRICFHRAPRDDR